MAASRLDPAKAQEALDVYTALGSYIRAADKLKLPLSTCESRVKRARMLKLKPSPGITDMTDISQIRHELKRAEKEIARLQKERLDEAFIRRNIINLTQEVTELRPPAWTMKPKKGHDHHGVPLLFLSDLHWGEKVEASQINGVNRYNVKIAHARMERLVEGALRLLSIISPKLDYPGIVIPLGGDMISGNIHDELTATNEMNSMEAVLDLFTVLCGVIEGMANRFGHVLLPCVTGNHGRDTTKIWNKDRHKTSFDWLLYCFLAKRFEGDKRIQFYIPDGPDALFKIYGYRYLLTHGDQFRGGDGMIGALGPIIRGDHKKRSRNTQIDMDYDTMILGHWHQYIHLTRLIVNGTMKGYDEYAFNNNFTFEPPQQALWITHPTRGITFRSPVFVEKERVIKRMPAWASMAA
jgi:hypothetical protein